MEKEEFDPIWDEIYSEGRQINKYPFDSIVSMVFKLKGKIKKDEKQLKLLELGCGCGNNLLFAANEGFDIYGIDASQYAIKIAKKFLNDNNVDSNLTVGSFSQLPYPDNFFDLVIERGSLGQASQSVAKKAVLETHRVLKTSCYFYSEIFSDKSISPHVLNENGTIVVHDGPFKGCGNMTFYTEKMLMELMSSFSIEELSHINKYYLKGDFKDFNESRWLTLCKKN
tara:strand:- start:1274 stop:1951 length:678 start_codon:yes stop_codon:yes gene_type:complete